MIKYILLLAGIICVSTISSQELNDSTQNIKPQFIDEVSVQAPINISSQQKWPGGYSKLSTWQIHSGNSYQLSEQLNSMPGVFMQQGTMSTNRITIRGVGSRTPYNSNRIKAYWGEMPLTDGDGITSIEDMSLNDMGSVQVLKGPSSALYGAGLGGVILIDPFVNDSSTQKIYYKSEFGSFQTWSNQLNINLFHSSKSKIVLTGGSLNSDGYRQNSRYKRYHVTLKGKQRVGNNYLTFLYNYRFLNGEIPSSLDSVDFHNSPSKAAFSWNNIQGYEESKKHLLSIGLLSPLSNKWLNSVSVFGRKSDLDELRPFNRLQESKNSIGIREKLVFNQKSFRLETGIELMHENNNVSLYELAEAVFDAFISSNKIKRNYYNLFGLMEYQFLNNLLVQASANLNQTHYSSQYGFLQNEEVDYTYDWIVSPRLGLNYMVNSSTYIFASLGHGFSAPSVEESQMPDGSFNQNIKPEEGMSYELGYRYVNSSKRIKADLTLYSMKMKNLLVTKRDNEDEFFGVNAGETTHKGIESSIHYKLIPQKSTHSLMVGLSFFTSENKFKTFVDDGNDYKGNHLPGIPEYNMNVNLSGNYRYLHFYIDYKRVGSQYLTDGNEKEYGAYDKVGAKLSYDITISKLKGNINIGCDNLFDNHYASMVLINAKSFGTNLPRYYYPGLPFNLYGGVAFRF